ncbi:MmgE/PrpD family protein [Thermodesulfobacteriota bacterium]
MDIMEDIVKNILRTGFTNLTPESVTAAKKGIVDTAGVMLAGSSDKGCRLLIEAIKEMGGKKESSIAVFGDKVPSNMAALANGSMARAMDIDDVSDTFALHTDAVIVPTALAIADRQEKTDGRDLITAVALGQDLMVRMALAVKLSPLVSGRFNLYKVFAATATAGKLLGLDEEQLSNAMGIAYSHLVGDAQSMHDGVMTSYIQEGEAAKSAIESAIFAEKGITGTKNVLQGPKGFFNAFEPDPDLEALTLELGKYFHGAEIAIKPYASCRTTHQAIDLALDMVKNEGINPNRIDRVTVRVNDQAYNLTCHPLEHKRRPKTRSEAQFSMPFTVAAALIKGDFFIAELSDEVINDPDILKLAERVTPVKDDECKTDMTIGITVMELETKDGQKLFKKKLFPLGNPNDPVDMNGCLDKFRKCVKYAHRQFPSKQIDRIMGILPELEKLDDVHQLIRLFVPVS